MSPSEASSYDASATNSLFQTDSKNGEINIMEIALVAGYQNPSHFTRAFRRYAGLSPIEYRMSALGRR